MRQLLNKLIELISAPKETLPPYSREVTGGHEEKSPHSSEYTKMSDKEFDELYEKLMRDSR